MVGVVDSSGITNVTLAEAGDSANWADQSGGQGSSQGADFPRQGAEHRVRKIDNTVSGFSFLTAGTIDLSGAGTHVGIWAGALQAAALNFIDVFVSGSTNFKGAPWEAHRVNAAEYLPIGDPNARIWFDLSRGPDSSSGTYNAASTAQLGAQFSMQNVAGNAPNCGIDRIDYTVNGVALTGGTLGSPATISDIVADDDAAQYGAILDVNGTNFLYAPISIGGVNTHFEDSLDITSADQLLCSDTFMTITFDMTEVTSVVRPQGGTLKSGGTAKRLGLSWTGSQGEFTPEPQILIGLRAMTLYAGATFPSWRWDACGTVTINGATLTSPQFNQPNTASGEAALNGSGTDLSLVSGATFVSSGTGHAFELVGEVTSNSSINWDATDSGYAAVDGSTGNETILCNVAAGVTLTINVAQGASTPTYHNVGLGTVIVASSVPITITVLNENKTPRQDVRVYAYRTDTFAQIINGVTDVNGQITENYTSATPQGISGWARDYDLSGVDYTSEDFTGTITSTGFDQTLTLEVE